MTPLSDSEARTVARFENAEPAPESWGGGLRRAVRLALAQWSVVPLTHIGYIADGVLEAIEPELAALRAKADAADRVRALAEQYEEAAAIFDRAAASEGKPYRREEMADAALEVRTHAAAIRRALDGGQS